MRHNLPKNWSSNSCAHEITLHRFRSALLPNELFVSYETRPAGTRLSELHSQIECCSCETATEIQVPHSGDGHSPGCPEHDDHTRVAAIDVVLADYRTDAAKLIGGAARGSAAAVATPIHVRAFCSLELQGVSVKRLPGIRSAFGRRLAQTS